MTFPHKVVLVDYDEDLFAPRGWEASFMASAGIEWVEGQWRDEASAVEQMRDADVVIIQSLRKLLNARTIPQLRRCRGLIRAGIGYDTIDVAAATAAGLLVCNVPNYCVEEVADHALALLLAGVRNLGRQDRSIHAGAWRRELVKPARRLRGQTLGLVAFGRVARSLAEKGRGLGWRVLAFDPFVPAETIAAAGVTPVALDDLLREADLISVHAPLSAATRHLIGEREFGLMKAGAIFVNTARGPVVDEAALARALRAGRLGGAGLDVFEAEPLPADSPLLQVDNVILTPHTAAYSEDAVDDLYRSACEEAIDIIQGRRPAGVVNAR
jgi:D-3-phosphoglycerate dehydrogenase